jgi:acetyl/propionyl-CoA carboxylase alpha subunit
VPGSEGGVATVDEAMAAAESIGFPVLIKAASGGGGKGMRDVRSEAEAVEAISAARREAERAFAAGALYVERLVPRPRHIEVQIFGDTQGHVIHLFERDCTLQRRHQKVIEEAPGPTITPTLRERITAAAVAAARAVGYVNAGTCEFLLDGEGDDAPFYFLEMNTRLQVEHPVTEAITGLDLVHLQLRIAAGEALPIRQEDVRATGHAIECRVYAEDSATLLPQSGRLLRYREPEGLRVARGEGLRVAHARRVREGELAPPGVLPALRVDGGVREGQAVTVYYDPLLAKVITHGQTRDDAIAAMRDAIGRFEILGLRHNLPFLGKLLAMPEMRSLQTYTTFIEDRMADIAKAPADRVRHAAAAIAAMLAVRGPSSAVAASDDRSAFDPWRALGPVVW